MNLVTVFGGFGFIGKNLINKLYERSTPYYVPTRDEIPRGKYLGDVIYAIGLTADFRAKPYETITAHVSKFLEIMKTCEFNSITYLSSTRVYGRRERAREQDDMIVNPQNPEDLYNISKLAGEALVFSSGVNARVVRLSNVYGYDPESCNFISAIIREAIFNRRITLNTSLESSKDYISIHDAVDGILKITNEGREKVYNLASGFNVTHRQVVEKVCSLTGTSFDVKDNAPTIIYPQIDISRIRKEFGFQPSNILTDLNNVIEAFGYGRK